MFAKTIYILFTYSVVIITHQYLNPVYFQPGKTSDHLYLKSKFDLNIENYEFKIKRLPKHSPKNSRKNIDDYESLIKIFTTAENQTFPEDEDRIWQPTFDRTIIKKYARNVSFQILNKFKI